MKKEVNGKLVEIGEIEGYREGLAGIAKRVRVYSELGEVEGDWSKLIEVVGEYRKLYKSLPFPLYGIESEIKYWVIGNEIKRRVKGIEVYLGEGLEIEGEGIKGKIRLQADSWGIGKKGGEKERVKIGDRSLEGYWESAGYEQFKWIDERWRSGKATKDYYKNFMGEFLRACEGKAEILKRELEQILEFGERREKINLPRNRVVDMRNGTEYVLDIYRAGKRKLEGGGEYIFSKRGIGYKPREREIFGLEVYGKQADKKMEKIEVEDIEGIYHIFLDLVGLREVQGSKKFGEFTGCITGEHLVYWLDDKIRVGKIGEYGEVEIIASGYEIEDIEEGKLYISRETDKGKEVWEYEIEKKQMRLYGVYFE